MQKRSIENTVEDVELRERLGFKDLRVWWLVGQQGTGTDDLVFQICEYPPGIAHDLHRHHGASEVLYVLEGEGIHLMEDDSVPVRPGEVVYIPRMEWHGLENRSDRVMRFVGLWPGVGSYENLGLEYHPSVPPERRL